jgi:Flp pilus assembly protein TadB
MMHDWSVGIFSVIPVMIGIVGSVLAMRLAYINEQYNKMISNSKDHLLNIEKKRDVNEKFYIKERKKTIQNIEHYESLKSTNKHKGLRIDIISIFIMILMMFLLIFGIAVNYIHIISIISVTLLILSLLNFRWHLNAIKS